MSGAAVSRSAVMPSKAEEREVVTKEPPLTVGSLYSGVGGLDLGLERAGMRVVWQAEIDDYASRVLRKHWPAVPNYGDVTRVDWSTVERPDVLVGGFMCTDISTARRHKGTPGLEEDTRSGVTFREFIRAIGAFKPGYVLVENVPNLIVGDGGRWFGTVLRELAALGYDAEWDCIPAAFVGAPHLRYRVFIVAYPNDIGCISGPVLPRSAKAPTATECDGRVSDWRCWREHLIPDSGRIRRLPDNALSGSVDGISGGVDRIRGLGNAVVPAVAELVGGWIVEHARKAP